MIVVGWLIFAGGYSLVYYGVSMWRYYTQVDVPKKGAKGLEGDNPDGMPLSILLGLKAPVAMGSGNPIPSARPPFNMGGTIYGVTPHTSAIMNNSTNPQPGVTQL